MSEHDNLLNGNSEMCSFGTVEVAENCSNNALDTCGDGCSVGQHRRKA